MIHDFRFIFCFFLIAPFLQATSPTSLTDAAAWPGFRGFGDSHTSARNLPLTWNDGEHLAWTKPLPGYGQSSPVIYDGVVFVTSVMGSRQETVITSALDLGDGEVLWRRRFPSSQTMDMSDMKARAAPTPQVDASGLYVFFGSGDLIAFDHDGNRRWQRSLTKEYGNFEGNHGVGSSPVMDDKALYLLINHDGPSYLLSLDKQTGKNIWKKDLPSRISWTTPRLNETGDQLIVSSNGFAGSFQTVSGEILWQLEGLKKNTVPSPTLHGELIIIPSSQKGETLAIRRGGSGSINASHIAWKSDLASSFATPLIHEKALYVVNKAGVLFRASTESGRIEWKKRLADSCWASPVAAGNRLYFFCKNGVTHVFDGSSKEANLIATNTLTIDERVYGVAIAEKMILLRTGSKLFKITTIQPNEDKSATGPPGKES